MADEPGGKGVPAVSAGFYWQETSAGLVLRCAALDPHATHAFTTRHLEFRDPTLADDYARLAEILDVATRDVLRVTQVHGRVVLGVKPGDALDGRREADAIVTTDESRAASVRVADCVPILLADRQHRLVAAVHAGWRGTLAGVATATVAAIGDLGVTPRDLVAAIGPSIGPCCYQVDGQVRDRFVAAGSDVARWFQADGPSRWKLDLWQANADQLVAVGLAPANVHVAALCTFDHPGECFSYRRDGASTGRMVAAIRSRPARDRDAPRGTHVD